MVIISAIACDRDYDCYVRFIVKTTDDTHVPYKASFRLYCDCSRSCKAISDFCINDGYNCDAVIGIINAVKDKDTGSFFGGQITVCDGVIYYNNNVLDLSTLELWKIWMILDQDGEPHGDHIIA